METAHHDLLDALHEPHCALCRLAASSGRAYLSGVMRDGVNDARIRDEWRRRHGLCALHWGVWRSLETPPLSSAILTRDLLGSLLARPRPPSVDCRACDVEREAASRSAAALASLPTRAVESALAEGRGFVCLRHLPSVGPRHEGRFRRRLEELVEELGTFIRKSDYRFAHEPLGDEGDAWLRAIRALGGAV